MFSAGKGKGNEEVKPEAVRQKPKTRIEVLQEQKAQAEAQYRKLEEPARLIGDKIREARLRVSHIDNNMHNIVDVPAMEDLLKEREEKIKTIQTLQIAEHASKQSLETARGVIQKIQEQIDAAMYRAQIIKVQTIPYIRSDIATSRYYVREAQKNVEMHESKVAEAETNLEAVLAELAALTGEDMSGTES
jgi:chromosome segregation ATPase